MVREVKGWLDMGGRCDAKTVVSRATSLTF